MFGKKMGKVAPKMVKKPVAKPVAKPVVKPVAKPVAKPAIGGKRGNVEQNYRGVPGLVNATGPMPKPVVGLPGGPVGKTMYRNDPRPVTGVINPRVVPPANASPPPATGGSLYDAKMGRQNPTPPMSIPANSLANVGTTGFKRAMADSDLANKVAPMGMKKGGSIDGIAKRADGIAKKGKTKGRMV